MFNSLAVRNNSLLRYNLLHIHHEKHIQTMKTWMVDRYGSPDLLQSSENMQIPIIKGPMDVLVKVHAASINPLDVKMLEGYGKTVFGMLKQITECSFSAKEFPLIPGRDFSGKVVHVGKAVTKLKYGDEVWGVVPPQQNGSHAEYVLTNICSVSSKPNHLSHVEAASFPYAALTAWSALNIFGGLSEKNTYNKRILVTGASGGVGTFAVQLLKAWGAEVSVTCRADASEMLQNLGADNVLDYQSPDFKNDLKQLNGLDFIFDNVGCEYPGLTMDLLKKWKNAKYVTVVSPLLKNTDKQGLLFGTCMSASQAALDTIMSIKDGCSFRWAFFIPSKRGLVKISKMIDKKEIVPVVEKTYSFEEISAAYADFSNGHARGKTVIDFSTAKMQPIDSAQEKT